MWKNNKKRRRKERERERNMKELTGHIQVEGVGRSFAFGVAGVTRVTTRRSSRHSL